MELGGLSFDYPFTFQKGLKYVIHYVTSVTFIKILQLFNRLSGSERIRHGSRERILRRNDRIRSKERVQHCFRLRALRFRSERTRDFCSELYSCFFSVYLLLENQGKRKKIEYSSPLHKLYSLHLDLLDRVFDCLRNPTCVHAP